MTEEGMRFDTRKGFERSRKITERPLLSKNQPEGGREDDRIDPERRSHDDHLPSAYRGKSADIGCTVHDGELPSIQRRTPIDQEAGRDRDTVLRFPLGGSD